jgi:hypothetical protein
MKIALIEDRISRLEQYCEFDIKNYTVIDLITGVNFDNLKDDLCKNKFDILLQYNCIIAHRSAFTNEMRESLKSYCRNNKTPLVFFSGGISSSILNDKDFPYLQINSKDFYSSNLEVLIKSSIETNNINLLQLQFGNNWKLSLLLNLRNKLATDLNYRRMIENLPNFEIEDNLLIKRYIDLNINTALKNDILNTNTRDFIEESDIALISYEKLIKLYNYINIKINEYI